MEKNTQAEKMLKLLLKASNFNSLLDYYRQYYICFDELGREVLIEKEDFDYLCTLVPSDKIVRAE